MCHCSKVFKRLANSWWSVFICRGEITVLCFSCFLFRHRQSDVDGETQIELKQIKCKETAASQDNCPADLTAVKKRNST